MTVVELRQYTLVPGRRDTLIGLFETDLEAAQEQCGIKILGTFRDLNDPQRFVWIRSFLDMEQRAESLARFYGGPVWRRHRTLANETMLDSDNVLLLRPGWPDDGLAPRTFAMAAGAEQGVVQAGIVSLAHPVDEVDLRYFRDEIAPEIERAGATVFACLVTEPSVNTFPPLPIREGENVLVWLAGFPDRVAHRAASNLRDDLAARTRAWPETIGPLDLRALGPTRTSRLTGRTTAVSAPVQMIGRRA